MLPPPEELALVDLKGRKILMVDDDRLNLRILRGILQHEGYVLDEADSAESALLKYEKFQPDLVLFDVVLPGINGFEACRELRRRHGTQAAPVMFITAKQESDDVVEGFSAGGVDYVMKPFRQKEVVARIRTHLQIRLLMDRQLLLVEQLSRANAAKNKFLGMAAHDLRNPLASIRGLAEFLSDGTVGPLAPEQLELINLIQQASQGMVTLVNDLLDVATIESGELKLDTAPASLVELIEKSVTLNALESARKQTQILFTGRPAAPSLTLDGAKIRQVIDNLLSNAVKYSPPGSTVRVALSVAEDGTQVIRVRDEGPGIPENERDRLFKDFSRLSARPTGGEKSTGLGLAICRKIVEAHHGTIVAENHPAGGCEFQVFLPPSLS
ncbi:MAG: response regulator receiver sensor signal transduction histidine kinase [Rariglobus sp.]|jgi:signal transduction histidine kinase|nr:response regulator receiver sensor signal transduction histidine kinase [Rariglobus sp.]